MIKTVQMSPADKFTDSYGDEFPNAILIINGVATYKCELLEADLETNNYVENSNVDTLSYNVNFWSKPQLKQIGKRSRVLMTEDFEKSFAVPFADYEEHYDPNNHRASILAICEKHLRNEVIPTLRG